MEITDKVDIKGKGQSKSLENQTPRASVKSTTYFLDSWSMQPWYIHAHQAWEGAAGFEVSHYSPPHIPSTLI